MESGVDYKKIGVGVNSIKMETWGKQYKNGIWEETL